MRLIFGALWVVFAGMLSSAHAQGFRMPALFDVTDVIAPDTLNVRAAPDADAKYIGDLAADATGIEVLTFDDSGKWGLINWHDSEGWLAMRFL